MPPEVAWHRREVWLSLCGAAAQGAVKCITTAAGIVASGGADDLVHLYDIQVQFLIPASRLMRCCRSSAVGMPQAAILREGY